MEKECICCKITKPISDYYKHSGMKDGHLNKCKECQKQNTRDAKERNYEYYKEYDRVRAKLPHRVEKRKEYQKTDAYKQSHKKSLAKQKLLYPNKTKARYKLSNAIRDGEIKKLPCLVCGELNVEGHHPDYDRPLDVIWLCTKHHNEIHNPII